jgi:sucrose-6-phosphate hydrolase SacC (GH32 family)
MVAIYTADYHDERKEAQYLAYSNDRGRTWTKYANNPVLDLNMKDFRDPNVIWHKQTQQWIMSVAFPKEYKIVFFRSKNLKNWERLGDFGNQGEMRKIWECPSLIEVPLDSSLTHTKWVLMVSTNGADKDYTGMQYFVGHFNGHTFINEHTPDTKLYVDYGKDFYAAIPFNNLPDKKPIIIGWMNSWQYAEAMPTFPWNGQMSIPRTLTLRTTPEGIRLFQQPVENLKTQNPYNVFEKNDFVFKKEKQLDGITLFSQNTYMVETQFKLKGGKYIGLIIGQKKKQKDSKKTIQETIIGYDVYTKRLYIDRRISGKIIHKDFATIEKAHLKLENKLLKLKVLVDKSSVEVFANDGKIVMTDLIFPADSTAMFSLFSHRGKVAVKTLKITDLSQKPLHKLLLN